MANELSFPPFPLIPPQGNYPLVNSPFPMGIAAVFWGTALEESKGTLARPDGFPWLGDVDTVQLLLRPILPQFGYPDPRSRYTLGELQLFPYLGGEGG